LSDFVPSSYLSSRFHTVESHTLLSIDEWLILRASLLPDPPIHGEAHEYHRSEADRSENNKCLRRREIELACMTEADASALHIEHRVHALRKETAQTKRT
jgi:hypothetical protein